MTSAGSSNRLPMNPSNNPPAGWRISWSVIVSYVDPIKTTSDSTTSVSETSTVSVIVWLNICATTNVPFCITPKCIDSTIPIEALTGASNHPPVALCPMKTIGS